jgi:hypothetical protein
VYLSSGRQTAKKESRPAVAVVYRWGGMLQELLASKRGRDVVEVVDDVLVKGAAEVRGQTLNGPCAREQRLRGETGECNLHAESTEGVSAAHDIHHNVVHYK